jgi:hypothetical protein
MAFDILNYENSSGAGSDSLQKGIGNASFLVDEAISLVEAISAHLDKGSIEICREGNRIFLKTSQESVRHSRRNLQIGFLAVAMLFVALAFASPFFLIGAATAIFCLFAVPLVVKTAVLIEIDAGNGEVILRQDAVEVGLAIPAARIKTIEGIYETQGWEPRNVIYATLVTGKTLPVMVLSGTDEHFTEDACRVLGVLLCCPATYTGAYSSIKICFDPLSRA